MSFLLGVIGWTILFVLCWPAALALLLLLPLIWVVALPFRIVGWIIGGTLALLRALLFLPARLLGHRG